MNKVQYLVPLGASETYYTKLPNTKLPENHVIRDGFLYKGDSPVSLVTSGIIEVAAQGFLYVDDDAEYKTR